MNGVLRARRRVAQPRIALMLVAGALIVFTIGTLGPRTAIAQRSLVGAAGDTRTPITTLPFRINKCGSYFLADCLHGRSGTGGITIAANNVTVDLNGFTVQGVSGSENGIEIRSGFHNVRVFNGNVLGWGEEGLLSEIGATGIQIDHVRFSNNGANGVNIQDIPPGPMGEPAAAIVTDCIAEENGKRGFAGRNGVEFVRCVAVRNNVGIGVTDGLVKDCLIEKNDDVGLDLGNHARATDNVIVLNNSAAVAMNNIPQVLITGNGCFLEDNDIGINQFGAGIRLDPSGAPGPASQAVIRGNSVFSCSGGIEVLTSRNVVVENILQQCGPVSIEVPVATGASMNVIARNVLNTGGAPGPTTGILVSGMSNTVTQNVVAQFNDNYNVAVPGNDFGTEGTAAALNDPWGNVSSSSLP